MYIKQPIENYPITFTCARGMVGSGMNVDGFIGWFNVGFDIQDASLVEALSLYTVTSRKVISQWLVSYVNLMDVWNWLILAE